MLKRLLFILTLALIVSVFCAPSFAAPIKAAIVTSPNDVHDGGFNEDNYNGLLEFMQTNPDSSITTIQDTTGDPESCIKTTEGIVADYDAIVCVGFQFAGVASLADDNPDVKFILVDTFPTDENGATVSVENLNAMMFKEEEGGFLAGIAAALSTKTKKVAVVNGIAFPTNVNYQYGFMSGVNYANKHFNTGAQIVELPSYAGTDVTGKNVGGNYVGSFIDQANGKIVGQALIREGCDVIFVAAGGAGMGVFTAAKEAKDVYIIGCDADQYNDGANGDTNIILTSSLKVMGKNDARILRDVAAGNFKGGNYLMGADSDSISYVKTPGRHQLTDDAITKLDAALALLKAGTIKPASSSSGTMPDNFTGLDAE